MYKLRVIAGPLRGNTYDMKDGENVIGRVGGSDVLLSTPKVSKRHCLLVVNGGQVTLQDAGSSNGTFVNGVLSKVKKLVAGDRISVGEHELELVKPAAVKPVGAGMPAAPRPAAPAGGNVVPFGRPNQGFMAPPLGAAAPAAPANPAMAAPPKDLIEKVKFYFEKYVINALYTLNEKQQWNFIVKGLIAALVVFTVWAGVSPVLQKTYEVLLSEGRNRARALARLMVDRNQMAVIRHQEPDLDVNFAEREEGIVAAYIVDMDLRIMAPGKKLNQTLTDGQQGRFAENARRFFAKNERYFSMPYWNNDGTMNETYPILQGNMLGLAEPIKVLDPSKGQNVTVAFAVVFLDLNGILMDPGGELVAYITALIFASIMAVAVYASLHRITTRPITHLNSEIDRALRGDIQTVSLPFKMEEMEPLVQVINTVLSKAAAGGGVASPSLSGGNDDDFVNPAKFAAMRSSSPMMVLTGDMRLAAINPAMEEVTGIRGEGSLGNDVAAFSRDEAFTLMLRDITSRAPLGAPDGASDSIEFSGKNYRIEAVGLGSMGGMAKGYVVTLQEAA